MNDIELSHQEFDDELIEDIKQLSGAALGVGTATYQACGTKIQEGNRCTAYAFRPAENHTFHLGNTRCPDHSPPTCDTLGVRELRVSGRIGRCVDQATQSAWPVLLAPQPQTVSPADTTHERPAGTAHPMSPPEARR